MMKRNVIQDIFLTQHNYQLLLFCYGFVKEATIYLEKDDKKLELSQTYLNIKSNDKGVIVITEYTIDNNQYEYLKMYLNPANNVGI